MVKKILPTPLLCCACVHFLHQVHVDPILCTGGWWLGREQPAKLFFFPHASLLYSVPQLHPFPCVSLVSCCLWYWCREHCSGTKFPWAHSGAGAASGLPALSLCCHLTASTAGVRVALVRWVGRLKSAFLACLTKFRGWLAGPLLLSRMRSGCGLHDGAGKEELVRWQRWL